MLVNVYHILNQFWGCKYYVGDVLVGLLEVGDNLAINVEKGNFEGLFFYLIRCTKAIHKVREAFTNHWDTSFNHQ